MSSDTLEIRALLWALLAWQVAHPIFSVPMAVWGGILFIRACIRAAEESS
jgi:hypothetical protein